MTGEDVVPWDSAITVVSLVMHLFVKNPKQTNNKENVKDPYHLYFAMGIHQWMVDSPHKCPLMQKAFPCSDIISVKEMPTVLISMYIMTYSGS